tara:strand:+ start:23761 stop:24231 length:471 start_codon:yes stop_codon:yes gene_type:complete
MSRLSNPNDLILKKTLAVNGYRFTGQRAEVYRILTSTSNHPTAEEVFLGVREKVPEISLATVYKNLETLVSCGLASKMSHADGSARYDGRSDPHHHTRCISCGCVSDIPGEFREPELSKIILGDNDFHITGYHLELTGYCSECAREMDDKATLHAS